MAAASASRVLGDGLWDRDRMKRGDVPTLQEAFACCDHVLLSRLIVEGWALPMESRRPSAERCRLMERRVEESLDEMCSMPLDRKGISGEWLLPSCIYLPVEAGFDLREEGSWVIKRRIEIRMLDESDALNAEDLVRSEAQGQLEGSGWVSLYLPSLRAQSWGKALAHRLWLGGTWNAGERLCVLAEAFWEMTYYGFSWEEVEAAQAQNDAAMWGKSKRWGKAEPSHRPTQAVMDRRRARALELGLSLPDVLAEDIKEAEDERFARLNGAAEIELAHNFLDALQRTGRLEKIHEKRERYYASMREVWEQAEQEQEQEERAETKRKQGTHEDETEGC